MVAAVAGWGELAYLSLWLFGFMRQHALHDHRGHNYVFFKNNLSLNFARKEGLVVTVGDRSTIKDLQSTVYSTFHFEILTRISEISIAPPTPYLA